MREIFEPALNILKTWKRVIIILGLEIFAYFVGIKFILFSVSRNLALQNPYPILALALLIFSLSFVFSRFFPQKFVDWDFGWIKSLKKEKKLSDKVATLFVYIFLFSPLSSFFMSLGLALFIFSFFKPGASLWQRILVESEEIYEFLGRIAFVPFYLFIAVVVGLILPQLIFGKLLKKEKISKWATPIWFVFVLIILRVHAEYPLPLLQEMDKFFLKISPGLVKFLIGAPPTGWFYELFIGSIEKEKI